MILHLFPLVLEVSTATAGYWGDERRVSSKLTGSPLPRRNCRNYRGDNLLGEAHQETPLLPPAILNHSWPDSIDLRWSSLSCPSLCPDILLFTSEQFLSLPSKKINWAHSTNTFSGFLYSFQVSWVYKTTQPKFLLFFVGIFVHIAKCNWLLTYIIMGLREINIKFPYMLLKWTIWLKFQQMKSTINPRTNFVSLACIICTEIQRGCETVLGPFVSWRCQTDHEGGCLWD